MATKPKPKHVTEVGTTFSLSPKLELSEVEKKKETDTHTRIMEVWGRLTNKYPVHG